MDKVMALMRAADLAENIKGKVIGQEPANDSEHFYRCPVCSQLVDRRRLGEVLHHEIPNHRPLPAN